MFGAPFAGALDSVAAGGGWYRHAAHLSKGVGESRLRGLYVAASDALHVHIDPCGEIFWRSRVGYIELTKAHSEYFSRAMRKFFMRRVSAYLVRH